MDAQKIASYQSDLVAAAAVSKQELYKVLVRKVAALKFTPEEAEYAGNALASVKLASPPNGYDNRHEQPQTSGGNDTVKKVLLGAAALSGPAIMAGQYISGKINKARGWEAITQAEPQLVASNPERAQAIYGLIHSTSPDIASNTPIAADLMRQMMSVPQIDLGTIKGLSDIRKNVGGQGGREAGLFDSLKDVKTVHDTHSMFADAFKGGAANFMGDGLPQQQANNADSMNQQASMSGSLLPLDTAIREILAKEQELMQREQMLQQQEQQVQQYMQQIQGAQQGFGQEFGVDPQTGQDVPQQGPEMAQQGDMGNGEQQDIGLPGADMEGQQYPGPQDDGGMPPMDPSGGAPMPPAPQGVAGMSGGNPNATTISLPLTISVSLGNGGSSGGGMM